MSNAILRGADDPFLQWLEQSYDPTSGFTGRREYRGYSTAKMSNLSNVFTRNGCSAVLRVEQGMCILTITDSTGNVIIDKWELGVEQEQPSIFENLIFLTLMGAADNKSSAITQLRNALQNGDPLNSAWDALIAEPNFITALGAGFIGDTAKVTKLKQYFDDYNLGVTNFIRGKYCLRHTTNAPGNWNANIADSNVEKIYTISQLLNEVQNTTLWVLPLPGYLAYKILHYVIPPARTNYIWGALKLRSNAVLSANSRVDITTEYLIDQASTNLYPTI